jgi:Tfp pilus assembly protein PilN
MSRDINLLQLPAQAAGPWISLGLIALAPALAAALVALAVILLGGQAHELGARLSVLEAATAARLAAPESDAAARELAALERAVTARRAMLAALKNLGSADSRGFAEVFRALARSTIDGVWLTQVTLDRDSATLRGRALGPVRLSAYLDILQHEPLFAGQAFNAIDLSDAQQGSAARPETPGDPAAAGLVFVLATRPAAAAPAGAVRDTP